MKSKTRFHFFDKTFGNILILFILPSLILSVSFIITYGLNLRNNKRQMEENYTSSLKLYSQVCETEILSVLRTGASLYHSQPLMDYLQDKTDLNASGTRYDIISAITQFKNQNDIIDDIFIIDQNDDRVITTGGIYAFDEFFDNAYVYKNYNSNYWQTFTFFDRSSYQILSPTTVHSDDKSSAIIPIVFRTFDGIPFSNYMVINISLDSLLNSNTSYRLTDNSSVFILSRYTGDVFGIENKYGLENILDTPLYKRLINTSPSFNHKFDREKVLIVAHSFSDNLLGYTYFVTVPYSDIYKMQSSLFLYTIVIYVVFLLIALYLSTVNAQKFANPLRRLAKATGKDTESDYSNIFEHINNSITSLQQEKADIAKTLPYAQEKYLINFLNSADLYIDESTRDIIKNSLPFKNDYYASVIFQIFPKREFFNSFSLNEYDVIFSELYNIMKSMFCEKFDAFFLSSERETLYIIINSDENHSSAAVKDMLDEICNLLQYDNDYLNIYTGLGEFHHGLNGLKSSHKEASDSLKSVPFDIPRIAVSDNATKGSFLTAADETKLYNSLVALDIPTARSLIGTLRDGVSDTQVLKHLHTQILNIVLRALQMKNLMSHDLFEEYISVLGKSGDDIYRYILVLIGKLETYKSNTLTGGNVHEVIRYINENFKDGSLSLDHLAFIFNSNANYISQIIKKHLGIGFHDYLSNLRISYARNLLSDSDKGIQEIYKEVGFYSKQTFFRVFKATVGITPSEYRKQTQKNGGGAKTTEN